MDRREFLLAASAAGLALTGLPVPASGSEISLGTAAAPAVLTKENALEWLISLGEELDRQNVPQENRYFVLSDYWIEQFREWGIDVEDFEMLEDIPCTR